MDYTGEVITGGRLKGWSESKRDGESRGQRRERPEDITLQALKMEEGATRQGMQVAS